MGKRMKARNMVGGYVATPFTLYPPYNTQQQPQQQSHCVFIMPLQDDASVQSGDGDEL